MSSWFSPSPPLACAVTYSCRGACFFPFFPCHNFLPLTAAGRPFLIGFSPLPTLRKYRFRLRWFFVPSFDTGLLRFFLLICPPFFVPSTPALGGRYSDPLASLFSCCLERTPSVLCSEIPHSCLSLRFGFSSLWAHFKAHKRTVTPARNRIFPKEPSVLPTLLPHSYHGNVLRPPLTIRS